MSFDMRLRSECFPSLRSITMADVLCVWRADNSRSTVLMENKKTGYGNTVDIYVMLMEVIRIGGIGLLLYSFGLLMVATLCRIYTHEVIFAVLSATKWQLSLLLSVCCEVP